MYRVIIDWVDRLTTWPSARRALPRGLARRFMRFVEDKENVRSVSRALSGRKANLDTIEAFLLGHPVRLRAPLVLISQAQRSGGTLLSQLFDGHPALAAHPHELGIGYPSDEDWPDLDPGGDAEETFRKLFDIGMLGLMRRGYTKGDRDTDLRRFFLVPRIQYRVFRHLYEVAPPANRRDILDYFFTSYFNAWLNYQGDLEAKRWMTGFAPRLAHHAASVAGFFDSYPDGRLIQLIRDPRTWYPSAKHHGKSGLTGTTAEKIISVWCTSAESILRNKALYNEKVLVLCFEDLVSDTETTMRVLCRELDIAFDPILLAPTFNGQPIRANSSFAVKSSGVLSEPLQRQKTLDEDERNLIDQRCRSLYDRVSVMSLVKSDVQMRAGVGG